MKNEFLFIAPSGLTEPSFPKDNLWNRSLKMKERSTVRYHSLPCRALQNDVCFQTMFTMLYASCRPGNGPNEPDWTRTEPSKLDHFF